MNYDRIEKSGIKIAPTGFNLTQNLYTSMPKFGEVSEDVIERQNKSLDIMKNLFPNGLQEPIKNQEGFKTISQKGLDANSTISGMYQTQDAINNLKMSKEKKLLIYDIESLGTFKSNNFTKSQHSPFGGEISQISLNQYVYNNGKLKAAVKDPIVLAVQISDSSYKELYNMLEVLEKDPNQLFNFNDAQKRSLADLALYSDESHFKMQEYNGKKVKTLTGQGDRVSYKGTALTESKYMERMKTGLKNLSDEKLVNTKEETVQHLSEIISEGTTLAGHNVENFDQPVLLEWLKGSKVKGSEELIKKVEKNQIDSYPFSKSVLGGEKRSGSYQLSSVFKHYSKEDKVMQAHFAGDDTVMNATVLEGLFSDQNKKGWDTGEAGLIKNGDLFYAKKGLSSYRESSYNKNRGEHDIVMQWDSKTKEWKKNYSFQQSPISSGHTYKMLAQEKGVVINDIEHYALVMQDMETGTRQAIFRTSETDVNDLFLNNLAPVSAKNIEEVKKVTKEDNARRFYDSLFEPQMKGKNDSIEKRLDKVKEVYKNYDEELKKVRNKDLDGTGINREALLNTFKKINKEQPDNMYWKSYEGMEKGLIIRGNLEKELPFWDNVIQASNSVSQGQGTVAKNKTQNLFVHKTKKRLDEIAPHEIRNKPQGGRQYIPVSIKGEVSYYGIDSKESFKSRIKQTLRINKNKSKSTVERDFNNLLAGDNFMNADLLKTELKKEVRREIENKGYVSEGTLDYVSDRLYRAANVSGKAVSSIPGMNIESAVSSGDSQRSLYMNKLSSKNSPFFDDLIKEVTTMSKEALNSGTSRNNFSNFKLDDLSSEASQRIIKAEEISIAFDTRVSESGAIFRFDNNQTWKKKSGTNYEERIGKSIKNMEELFNVKIDLDTTSDQLSMFFVDKKSNIDLSSLTQKQLAENKNIHKMSLPVFNDDFSMSWGGTRMMNKYTYDPNHTREGIVVKNTADRAFDEIESFPKKVKRAQELAKKKGLIVDQNELLESEVSKVNRKVKSGASTSSYAGDTNPQKKYATSSIEKNLQMGTMIDIAPHGDSILKENYPETYKQFKEWQKENNNYEPFIRSEFKAKDIRNIKNDILTRLPSDWNETLGNKYGMGVYTDGLRPSQAASGNMMLKDFKLITPLGQFNPTPRDQIIKTLNTHPLEESPLQEYLDNMYGEDSFRASRLNKTSITRIEKEAREIGTSEGVTSIGTRTRYSTDFEIKEKGKIVSKQLDIEIAEQTSKVNSASGNMKTEFKKRLDELKLQKKTIDSGVLSIYDGQTIIREGLLKNIEIQDTMNVRLKTGFELPKGIKELTEGFEYGNLSFEKPISFNQMKEMNLIDEKGMLTVGTLIKSEALEGVDDVANGISSESKYRIYKDSVITGIRRDENGDKLIIDQVQRGKNGTKIIDRNSGERTTLVGVQDELFDRLFMHDGKKIDLVREQINISRNPYGGMLSTLIDTDFENLTEELDSMAKGKKTKLPALMSIQEKLDSGVLTTQDLSKEDVRSNIFNDVFKPHLKTIGLEDSVSYDREKNQLVYENILDSSKMTGLEGQENYTKFLKQSKESFGFDERYAYTKTGYHNVADYQGLSVKPKWSRREFDILDKKLHDGKLTPPNEEHILYKHLKDLAEENPVRQGFIEQAQKITDARGYMKSGKIEGSGNLIVDMTGSFDEGSAINVIKNSDGNFVFNGMSLGEIPRDRNLSRKDYAGTMKDPYSIRLNNPEIGIEDVTIGDFIKENNSKAVLQLKTSENQSIKDKYLPILGHIKDGNPETQIESHEVQSRFESVFNTLHQYNSQDYTTQNLSHDQITENVQNMAERVNTSSGLFKEEMNRFLTNSKKSGLDKGSFTLNTKQSASFKLGTYNYLDFFEKTTDGFKLNPNKNMKDITTSSDIVKGMISGIEERILEANNINYEGMTKKQMSDRIIEGITLGSKDPIDVYTLANRFPTQSQGSIALGTLRIDENIKDSRMMMPIGMALDMGGDYDGDTVYANLDFYKKGTKDIDVKDIQRSLTELSEVEAKRTAKVTMNSDGPSYSNISSFEKVAELKNEEASYFFKSHTGKKSQTVNQAVLSQAATGIGVADNALVANRGLMKYSYTELYKNNVIDKDDYFEKMSRWDKASNELVQSFISAKKMNEENIGISDLIETGNDEEQRILNAKLNAFKMKQSEFTSQMNDLSGDNLESFIKTNKDIGLINKDNESYMREAFGDLRDAQEATSFIDGSNNPSFSVGKSSGQSTDRILDLIENNPGKLIQTESTDNLVRTAYGNKPEIVSKYFSEMEKNSEIIRKNYLKNNNSITSSFSDSASKQFDFMQELAESSRMNRENVKSSSIIDTFKKTVEKASSNKAVAAGAGFAAMWMLGSAIKSGPTPEGNEAQQEATPVEVNPAAMLTSPTARISPGAQNVQLTVSGKGNIDNETVAGIVNNQVSEMTGIPMQTQVNVTDNTQNLDKGFYQNTLNKILGF